MKNIKQEQAREKEAENWEVNLDADPAAEMQHSEAATEEEALFRPYNIGIVDDSKFNRGALKSILPTTYNVVLEANNGVDLAAKLKSLKEIDKLDLVIFGSDSDFSKSYQSLAWLKKNSANLKIIFIAENDDRENLLSILRQGVNSILFRGDYDPSDLIPEIKRVLEGERVYFFEDQIIATMIESLENKRTETEKIIINGTINEREKLLLSMLVKEQRGVDIADKLNVNARTVENIINNLFDKFQVKTRVGLAVKAIQSGILLD